MFKMSWALVAEHADEWTGDDVGQAAAVMVEKVEAAVTDSGMSVDAQAHFRETFLAPVEASILTTGKAAVESGRSWSDAAGPLLVVLAPAA
ncbi:hypothetical protein ACH4ZU_11880 [Streptomyces sp. NPDC020472]|uniref:hypothetical protein n=1 Tax=Streptomyces sp. NPDC020472 TaxID=3365075 RepID=UPI0037AB34BF